MRRRRAWFRIRWRGKFSRSVGARAVAIKMGQQRRLLASADLPEAIDHDIDMRTLTVWSAIVESFETMLETGNHVIRVVGPAPGGGQFIEAVIDELPLRQAMYRFSRNLLVVHSGSRRSPPCWSTSRCIICSCGRCGG